MIITDSILVEASVQVYVKNPELEGFERLVVVDSNDRCCIFHNEHALIISFAGTNDIRDIVADITFIKKDTSYGGIHQGFLEAYEEIQDDIYRTISVLYVRYNREETPLYVTGHSLGGAMALLFTRMFAYKDLIIKTVVFGAPRVGNRKWFNSFKECKTEVVRYVNNQDIVTKLPSVFLLYFHVGREVHFDKQGELTSHHAFPFTFFIRTLRGFKDHLILSYKNSIFKNNL